MEKKRKYLGTSEIKRVIEVWHEHIHELKGVHRNSHVFENMSSQLQNEHNIILTSTELRTRINNLTKKYRIEKRNAGKSGGKPSTWHFYLPMHNILEGNNAINISEDIKEEQDSQDGFDLNNLLESPHNELNDPQATYSSSESRRENAAPPDSPANSSVAASTPTSAQNKKRKNVYGSVYKLMARDHKMMKSFLNKTLQNDKIAIHLLRENNQLLEKLINKT